MQLCKMVGILFLLACCQSVFALDDQQKAELLNKQMGEAYLMKMKSDVHIITTESGLEYKVLEEGKGDKSPSLQDKVTVDYEGRLINGTVFDSSYQRGQTASFPVNGVIAGWQEALQLMKPGDVWELYIPSQLAYGERGVPGLIGPNEVLVFKVHLISIN
jgi:FKBP-type peptidyl-prolyl cis-trans isomerase FklB